MQAQARAFRCTPVGLNPLPIRTACKPCARLTRPIQRRDHAQAAAARPLSLVATTAAEPWASALAAFVSSNLPVIIACTVVAAITVWIVTSLSKGSRKYDANVGDEYDAWTKEGILEYYWGEHIHLGYYNEDERGAGDKRWQAKKDFKQVRTSVAYSERTSTSVQMLGQRNQINHGPAAENLLLVQASCTIAGVNNADIVECRNEWSPLNVPHPAAGVKAKPSWGMWCAALRKEAPEPGTIPDYLIILVRFLPLAWQHLQHCQFERYPILQLPCPS